MTVDCQNQLLSIKQRLSEFSGAEAEQDALIEALHEVAEIYAEAGQQGFSDGLVLLADQLSFIESELSAELQAFAQQLLDWYIKPTLEPSAVISALTTDQWSEPLPVEEAMALEQLLGEDLINPAEPSDMSELAAFETNASELEAASAVTLPDVLQQVLAQLQHDLPDNCDWLEEPIEQLSELELNGFSDLLAIFSAQCQDQLDPELPDTDVGLLAEAIKTFLNNPAELSLSALCQQLAAEFDAEDIEFMQPMLQEDLHKLAEQSRDQPLPSESEPELAQDISTALQPESFAAEDQASITAVKPAFLIVDFELLSQPQPPVDLDVVDMLCQTLGVQIEQWQAQSNWPDEDLLASTRTQLLAMMRALETVGLLGAKFAVSGLSRDIDWSSQQGESIRQQELPAVTQCLQAIHSYLQALDDKNARETLIDCCAALGCGPDIEQSAFLSGLLALATVKDPTSIERRVADADEVSLEREKEVDPDLMGMLKNELPQLSDEFSLQLQSIVSDQQLTGLMEAQRTAHTIKGLANMAGIRGIANLTHYLEDILELMTDSQQLPCDALGDDMLDAGDCLADMCEAVVGGTNQVPDQAIPYLQKIFDWHYQAKTEGVKTLAQEGSSSTGETATAVPDTSGDAIVKDAEPTQESGTGSSSQSASAQPQGAEETAEDAQLSVSVRLLNNLFSLAGESTTLNTQLEEELLSLRKLTLLSRDRYRGLERVMADLEQQLHEFSMRQQDQLDVQDDKFDSLEMDRYNELDSSISRLQEAAADVSEVSNSMSKHVYQLQELQSHQTGLQKETLDTIIRTRMVPVSSIVGRIQRIIRQAARATGKKVKLSVEGENVMIDSQILNQLVAPLMHMIRNSVDHGIETPHARFEISKPETGEIRLKFSRDNDRMLIVCEDDGAGIDAQRVREIAIGKGLIAENLELTEQECQRLILLPGFSTRDEVSQLSGRGVGMDVVNQQLAKLHGSLQIRSQQGTGTTLELSLPPSALTVRALLIRCAQQVVALSTQGVDQSILSIDGNFNEDRTLFTFEGQEYPVKSIEPMLGKAERDYSEAGVHPVLLIRMGDQPDVALMVSEILAHRELIFKEMGELIPIIPGISGLTILANGEVAPVVDVAARVRYADSGLQIITEQLSVNEATGLPKVMVVDDSISARQSIVNLLQDLGYEVTSAIDGLDAMNKMRDNLPDLLLTDYEMPRVNGVELASSVRNREGTADLPIVMITSRSTAKHREEAELAGVDRYITKPWTETQLLQTIEELLQQQAVDH